MTKDQIRKDCEKSNNLFRIMYTPWRYPQNWGSNITQFFRMFKWSWQRITRGYSDWDVWDFDNFLANAIAAGLIRLGDTTHSYPGFELSSTLEDWQKYLYNIAEKLYASNEQYNYYENEYYEPYDEEMRRGEYCIGETTLSKAFLKRENEIIKQQDKDFKEAWQKLGEVFYTLWD